MKRRLGKACLLFVEGIALVIALFAGGAFLAHWKLSHGGLSLNVMNARIVKAFETRLAADSDVSVGSLRLVRDSDRPDQAGPVRIVVNDLIVTDPEGDDILSLPELTFRLRTGDIIRGNIVPRYVEITGAAISFTRRQDGRIDFGVIRRDERAPETGESGNFLETLFGSNGTMVQSLFEGAILDDTSLTFFDELSNLTWQTSGAKAELWRTSAGYSMALDAPFTVGDDEALLRIDGNINKIREEIKVRIAANSAPVSSMVTMIAGPGIGDHIEAELSGSIDTTLDFQGIIQSSRIDLSVDDGQVTLAGDSVPFEEIMLRADYLPARRTFNIDELDYTISGNQGSLQGFVSLGEIPPDGRLQPSAVEYNLLARELVIDLPGITPEPLGVSEGDFAGRYLVEERRLVVDALDVDYFGESLAGSLEILLPLEEGQSTGVIADATLTGSHSPQQILRGWPLILAAGAREWIEAQLPSGQVRDIDYEMNMPRGAIRPETPLDEDMLRLTFSFSEATAVYVPGMTPLTGARGTGILKGNSFNLKTSAARIGDVAVTAGEVDMPRFMPKGSPAYYRATLDGKVDDILAIIDEEPLRFLEQAGFSADRFSGDGSFSMEIMRPQLSHVPEEDYRFSGSGTFSDATIIEAIAGYDVEAADGTVTLSQEGLEISGAAEVAGLPVSYDWSRNFGEDVDIRLEARGEIDTQTGDDMAIALRRFLRGKVAYELSARQTGESYDTITLGADLSEARLTLDMLNYAKPAGVEGRFDISLTPPGAEGGSGWMIEKLALDTADMEISGRMALQPRGELIEGTLDRFFIRDRADMRIVLSNGDNGLDAAVIGPYANIDLFGDNLFSRGDEAGDGQGGGSILPEDIRLSVSLDRLEMKQGVMIADYDALLSRAEGALTDISMSGEFTEGGSFVVLLEESQRNIGRTLTVETDNLGAVAGALFDISSIEGGNGAYRATLLTDGPIAGELEADTFRVARAPMIAKLLSAGSLTGLSDLLSGEGIEFNEVSADIQYEDGTLKILDARATGPSLGVSVGGDVDFDANSFDVNGAVAPAYGVNSVLGNIPGFGELLVSRKGEGIVAFSYMIDGPVSSPTVTVNALSLFTPGIFRRIFEPIRDGRPTTDELLDEAVRAANAKALPVAPELYTANAEQMKMLSDSLEVFRRQLDGRPGATVPEVAESDGAPQPAGAD